MMDPDLREENKQKTERAKRKQERMQDTGAYVL